MIEVLVQRGLGDDATDGFQSLLWPYEESLGSAKTGGRQSCANTVTVTEKAEEGRWEEAHQNVSSRFWGRGGFI